MTPENENELILEAPSEEMYICTDIHEGQLPKFLEDAVCVSDLAHQQDMLLLSTLTAVSYALPNVKLLHNQGSKEYYPNLITVVIAPPASGKGLMTSALQLIDPIDRRLQLEKKRAKVAADSSDVTFFESVMDCGGNGFMLATEIDEVSKTWKKNNGGYSSLLRQACEHEHWERTRYRGGKRYCFELDSPRLSAVLSGTEGQLKPLLGRGENGLASRILPYIVNDVMLFDERVVLYGDKYNENGSKVVFDRLGKELLARWEWLRGQEKERLWSWTKEQAVVFGKLIKDAERLMLILVEKKPKEMQKEMLKLVAAMVARMAVNLERIGLILSMLRIKVGGELPDVVYCEELDFRTVVTIGAKLFRHGFLLTEKLLDGEEMGVKVLDVRSDAAEKIEALYDKLPDRFSYSKIKPLCEELGITERTMKRYLKELIDAKRIIHLSKDNYRKTKL